MWRIVRLRRGSVFYKYLLSYLLIMLIPVAMSIFVFAKARSVLGEEAARANDLLLRQMQSHLDGVLGDVNRLSLMTTQNDRLVGLTHESSPVVSRDYYLAYLTVEDFRVYGVAIDSVLDFYIYLPVLDMVVSPKGYLTSRGYHAIYMARLGISYEEWMGQLRRVEHPSYISSRVETDSNAVVDTVAVAAPLPIARPTGLSRGWLVVHIDGRVFRDAFRGTAWTDRSRIVVYHRDQGIVAGSGAGIPPEILKGGRQGTVRIDGMPYICLRRDSEVAGLEYVSLVPADIYATRFAGLTRYTAIAFLLCLLVGTAVIYRSAVARYRPVRGLLDILKPQPCRTTGGSDEFAQISAGIERTLAEERLLREEADRSKPVLAQSRLRRLLTGQVPDDNAAEEELERLGVIRPLPYAVLALAEVDEGYDETTAREGAERRMGECALKAGACLVQDLDGAVGMLFSRPDDGIDGIRDLLACGKAEAERELPVHVAVGVSSAHRREDGLRILYQEARTALGYWLVKRSDRPIAFRDVLTPARSYDFPIGEETRLFNSICAGDASRATAILDGIYTRNLGQVPLSIEMARCLMFDLISTMVKAMDSIMTHDDDPDFWSRLQPVARLTACRSFERLRTEMGDILRDVCGHVAQSRSSQGERLREEILAFIHANYRDKNLCPDVIAAQLRRNAAYLSRFFHEQMSVGISGYIKRYRIAKAKDLLSEEHLTNGEIAERVGFPGGTTLIRAFKEVEGVTPGRFKTVLRG